MKGYKDIKFAKVDIQRRMRRGFPEVIFCQGKTKFQIERIAREIIKSQGPLLLTHLEKSVFNYLKRRYPKLKYNQQARLAYMGGKKVTKKNYVLVITGGTSDIPIAEEAATTLEVMGNRVVRLYDVGVAGVHRLLDNQPLIREAALIIVIAGMEGALASIVSGIVSAPVIAVPTSFGYGANLGGIAPLLTMLNSCSPGVAVVNIDNGFGAGYFASLINR